MRYAPLLKNVGIYTAAGITGVVIIETLVGLANHHSYRWKLPPFSERFPMPIKSDVTTDSTIADDSRLSESPKGP